MRDFTAGHIATATKSLTGTQGRLLVNKNGQEARGDQPSLVPRAAERMRVHELKRYDLKVTVSREESGRTLVQIALGSEARTLSLNEFTGFWLDMVEVSLEETAAQLSFLKEPHAKKTKKSPQARPLVGKRSQSLSH